MNSIPLPFYANSQAHDEVLFKFKVPPAARLLYNWLMQTGKPGKTRDLHKEDFDEYCQKIGYRPLSTRWFTTCLKKLLSTRLIKMVIRSYNYSYQIQAFHPWQLDDWVIDNENESSSKSNASSNKSNNSSKKQPSNPYSSVPSYRDLREKQSNAQVSSNVLNPETIAAAPQKGEELKEVFPIEQIGLSGAEALSNRDCTLQPQKTDLNINSVDDCVLNGKEKTSRARSTDVEEDNTKFQSLLGQIDDLGVKINLTIKNAVKTHKSEQIKKAIALYRQRKREDGVIKNPGGYFMQILKEGWEDQKLESIENPDDRSVFNKWYEYAVELGYCSYKEIRDGEQWVCMTGAWERYIDCWERGFDLDYLRKYLKLNRERNPNKNH